MGYMQETLAIWKALQKSIGFNGEEFQIVNNATDLGVNINYRRMKFLGNNSKRFDQGIEK